MRPTIFGPMLLALLCATAALAQVDYEPTPPPDTAANDRPWYRNGDAIPFAGGLYVQAGSPTYFNGNTMVPSGSYDGVTLYADTTLEPYSAVFVPIGDGLMRPYARARRDDVAGTAGADAFQRSGRRQRERIARPPAPPEPAGEQPEFNPPFERFGGVLVETARKPKDNAGMWLMFQGYRWEQAGESMALDPSRMTRVDQYYGHPVYADPRTPYIIYIPFRANQVAPFRRSGS